MGGDNITGGIHKLDQPQPHLITSIITLLSSTLIVPTITTNCRLMKRRTAPGPTDPFCRSPAHRPSQLPRTPSQWLLSSQPTKVLPYNPFLSFRFSILRFSILAREGTSTANLNSPPPSKLCFFPPPI